ncbi:MAG: carbon monoxide dehydrogenase subunit G [Alphaproteobacteria bacterium]|nr:carbon monoxide dehydrogenase subunit G [Alphaproteobacteria bacterium]
MDMTGERRIPAPRQKVWDALNDPEVLKASIPGCQTIERQSPTELTATVGLKLGPMQVRFNGKVTLSEIDPPNGYTISGEGQGGVAGFAKGGAKVALADAEDGGTLMRYSVSAQVGGKMAQLGARLIDSTAKSMADQFFERFAAQVAPPAPAPAAVAAAPEAAAPPPAPAPAPAPVPAPAPSGGVPTAVWVIGVIILVLAALYLGGVLN